jgi:hypothetical protein
MAPDAQDQAEKKGTYRDYLSLVVTVVSIVGVIAVAVLVMVMSKDDRAPETVLTATLPLFGAWVGTILAFYFGRENFEAATRSVTSIAKAISPEEKLKSIMAKDKMIARAKMVTESVPADKINLFAALDKLTQGDRLPILDEHDYPKYMLHRSAIEQYLVKKVREGVDPKNLTLQNLLDDSPELKQLVETSFVVVKEGATLAEAKAKMDAAAKCEDIFITAGGTKNEPITGWITNVIIQEYSKV